MKNQADPWTSGVTRLDRLLGVSGRKILILLIQVAVIAAAFYSAFLLRFDMQVPKIYIPVFLWLLPLVIAIKLLVFWRMGLFAGWWRYVSLPDLLVVLRASAFASLAFAPLALISHKVNAFPRSVLVIDGILCFLLLVGVRVGTRLAREKIELRRKGKVNRQEVIIVGAGAVGQTFVREIRQNPNLNMSVIGFLDSDPQRQRQNFLGVPVLGAPRELARIFSRDHVDLVIVAQPAVDPETLQGIVEACRRAGVPSKILPAVGTILNGEVSVRQIRDVQLEDLLGRPPVQLDADGIREFLRGRRVLVTGAGGSIGSEICRQTASFSPERLVLLDHAETPLFHIEQELRQRFPNLAIDPCLGDIRDRSGIRSVFAAHKPEVVFHAAAYKHVPMSECNPVEAVRNNVLGTRNVVSSAIEAKVQQFVMVSTDKAVNPTNAMGASKRVAEIYVQSMARRSATSLVTVRFGNVLGSNGSVVPIFKRQIERGGPLTVTHPDVTRYFMTIPEAVQLVLQAGSMGKGGEIFLLDMGEPVKIVKLAEEMIRLSGLRLNEDIQIVFTGLRPGEKLYEELLLAGEGIMPTPHRKIKIARGITCEPSLLDQRIERLFRAIRDRSNAGILQVLQEIVPEYAPGAIEGRNDTVEQEAVGKILHLKVVPR